MLLAAPAAAAVVDAIEGATNLSAAFFTEATGRLFFTA